MDDEASFLKDPSVVFMTSLLADVKRGAIQLPRFQRHGVWTLEQRLDLLDSVYRGIPIGAIMLWRTNTRIASHVKIGPHLVPESAGRGPHQYILDGGQRIATLLGALYAPPSSLVDVGEDVASEADDTFELYFDLKEQRFVSRSQSEELPEHWLPLTDALQTVTLLRFQRKLKGPESDEWVTRADTVATRFRAYKVPVILLGTDDIELATTTFRRINRHDTPMGDLDMVSALAWSSTFDLEERLNQQREEVLAAHGWKDLDDDVWLRCIKVILGLDLYAKPDEVRSALQKDELAVNRSAERLGAVADFLRSACKMERPSLVPYAHQIPLLVQVFSGSNPLTEQAREKVEAWFWLTTYAGLFAGISGDGLSRAQTYIEQLGRDGILRWPGRRPFRREALPKRFDFRHARARALSLQLAGEFDGGALDLAIYGADAMVQLVTKGKGRESPGNRFFSPRAQRTVLVQQLADPEQRRRHRVSDQAWAAFQSKNLEELVRLRTADLNAMEEQLVNRWSAHLEG